MVEFKGGGPGFIYKILKKPIKIKEKVESCILAVILTAGHCVCDTTAFQPIDLRIDCVLNKFEAEVKFCISWRFSFTSINYSKKKSKIESACIKHEA